MKSESKVKVLYILGPGHCGSTLLNMLLNGNDRAIGVSELNTLHRRRFDESSDRYRFWHAVRECVDDDVIDEDGRIHLETPYRSYKKIFCLNKEHIKRWSHKNLSVLSCISKVSNCEIIIDSSKEWQRLYLLFLSDVVDLRVIHLVRDGRAVLNSYYKKYGNFRTGYNRWVKSLIYALILRMVLDESIWLHIKYENLATKTEKTLRRICKHAGCKYSNDMLDFRSHSYVGVGGNRMREKSISQIKLDDSWKYELPIMEKYKFNLFGGILNKIVGY